MSAAFQPEGPGGRGEQERSTGRLATGAGRDTIYAPATGQGRAAIAIVRVSGPGTADAVRRLTRKPLPLPRRVSLRRLLDPVTAAPIDEAVVVWMPGPGTYTGEDQAEFHVHGGFAVKAALLEALSVCAGLRPAEPGEFTRRALVNGRLDLTAVEGLADLIEAETEAQRRQALRQLDGALSATVLDWRRRLVDALALCEAELDFVDEDDVPTGLAAQAAVVAGSVLGDVQAALGRAGRGERLRDGFLVVIAGPPNAGKSTLLNAIAGREVAIVSPRPGTTRDAIEIRCDLGGLPVTFVDTAGIRDSDDDIEREGVARALRRTGEANLVLSLRPCDDRGEPLNMNSGPAPVREVWTKADLPAHDTIPDGATRVAAGAGFGVAELLELVRREAEERLGTGDDALVTRERHRLVLGEVADALARIVEPHDPSHPELVAEDLRSALRGLARITGQVDVDEVLDRVFSSFCIGK